MRVSHARHILRAFHIKELQSQAKKKERKRGKRHRRRSGGEENGMQTRRCTARRRSAQPLSHDSQTLILKLRSILLFVLCIDRPASNYKSYRSRIPQQTTTKKRNIAFPISRPSALLIANETHDSEAAIIQTTTTHNTKEETGKFAALPTSSVLHPHPCYRGHPAFFSSFSLSCSEFCFRYTRIFSVFSVSINLSYAVRPKPVFWCSACVRKR